MKREYVANGVAASQVEVNPLFPTHGEAPAPIDSAGNDPTVAFVGRMTVLKGGDLLVEAIAHAMAQLRIRIRLLLIGDGPQRANWERLAADRGVDCASLGWLTGGERWTALRRASVLAVPSTWPEPFGLVGLEAAALGIPAVAFDVGGVREWLRPGVNGELAPADPPRASVFADALVRLLGDGSRLTAMGAQAVSVAREMSLDRHLDRLEAILAPVRSDANPARR
jgi:glycosyltransferase involved in cell wall biosynthesis